MRYGDGSLPLELPRRFDVNIIQPRSTIDAPSYPEEVVRAIENPVNANPLSQLHNAPSTTSIVVNGSQDINITKRLLDTLLDLLRTFISDSQNIAIIFPIDGKQKSDVKNIDRLHKTILKEGYELVFHDSRESDSVQNIGTTPTHSTPVSVNKRFLESDIRIGLGTIRPNIFTGVTGGPMSVLPFACGIKTIIRNAKLQATRPTGPLNLKNAASIDMMEASKIAGLQYVLNAIPDYNGTISKIIAGSPSDVWESSINLVRTLTEAPIRQKADIAIVSAGGSGWDKSLYDAVDCLYAAHEATEHGGVIVLIAECSDGPGPTGFVRGVSDCSSENEIDTMAETSFELGMERARFFWRVLSSKKLVLCSRLRESIVTERFHSHAVRDPQEGLELAKGLLVSTSKIALIPNGNTTIPIQTNSI
ncbi:MAG: DUF2088 domain-containing protein [Candidatus Thorarchaeota archaeon]|nr:DUF2088 domain-containing protein [Candidatus Thorarchaeota archaeon]